jgi:hypothetical protein
VGFRGRAARDGHGPIEGVRAGNNVREPGIETLGRGVYGRVRTVDRDPCFGQPEEGRLLGVFVCD